MHHSKHKYAVVQHIVVKIPRIITIRGIKGNKKPSNSLNLQGLFENTAGDDIYQINFYQDSCKKITIPMQAILKGA